MEIIFLILELLDIILEVIIPLIAELGSESISRKLFKNKTVNKYFALFGYIILGSLFGFVSYLIYPKRIVDTGALSGISIVVSPIIVGLIMKKWGEHRTRSKKNITVLATFWGGALFAFAYAIVRYLLITI